MAYSSTNGPVLLTQPVGKGIAPALWGYASTHTVAAVAASSFFSNGAALGMKAGDHIMVTELTTANAYTAFGRGVVTTVTAGAGATVVFTATST